MTNSIDFSRFEQLVQRFEPGARLLRAWALTGGVSAQVTALEIERTDGETLKLVVRQHGKVDLSNNPNIAADEFRLLNIVHSAGLLVPKPIYVDDSGEIFPTPYLVIEYIEGTTGFPTINYGAFRRQAARALADIHGVDISAADLSFLPEKAALVGEKLRMRPSVLDESLEEGRIRDALEAVWPPPQVNPSMLLHGDFWPGNLIYQSRRLAAIIDWEDAAIGDPLADLGNSRLEIMLKFGFDVHDFTLHYRNRMGTVDFTYLPYWDLYAALKPAHKLSEWASDAATEYRMREDHKWFVKQAFAALASDR